MKYNGIDLLDILDNRLHPSLHDQPGKPRRPVIEHNTLLSQLRAMKEYGGEFFVSSTRELQALMVGQLRVDAAINAFRTWDMNPNNK